MHFDCIQWPKFSPESNVLPKILPFCCKSGGNLSMGVNWCKSMRVICSEGVKWCKSWAAMGGLLRNYPPPPTDWNCHVRVGCNGLQWEDFSGITPPRWNCHVRVGWRLRRRSWGYRGCGFKTGSLQVWALKQCKIEGVKWCKSWSVKGGITM